MKGKIFKFGLKYIFPLIAFLIIIVISSVFSFGGYVIVTSMYLILNYYLGIYIFFIGNLENRKEKDSLYKWLDRLDGGPSLLSDLFKSKKNKDVVSNLEEVYLRLNNFTKYDKRKLKLLKAYYKTLNEDGPLDFFFKSIHGFILAIVIWGVNRGYILSLSAYNGDSSTLGVPADYITIHNYATFIITGILFFIVIINDYFKNKKRYRIIIEVLDVCIEEDK